MLLLVARQRHVFLAGSLQRLPRPGVASLARPYALQAKHSASKSPLSTTNSAIIVPRSVVDLQPENLIRHITPVDSALVARDRFAVFFVTPALAQWLLDDAPFLHHALRQTYKHLLAAPNAPHTEIRALCAVVDKLPAPRPVNDVHNLEKDALQRTCDPPVAETGFEGLAYATLRHSDSVESDSHAKDGNGAISFLAGQSSADEGYYSDSIRLPLANTIFQTGAPTTMTLSTWEKAEGASELTLHSKKNVAHHGVRFHSSKFVGQSVSALAVPLVPLTRPRLVDGSMGNIIRRVIGPDDKSVSASQELEKAVPQYFKARGEPSQPTSVWALVIPKDLQAAITSNTQKLLFDVEHQTKFDRTMPNHNIWDALWNAKPPHWNSIISSALSSGARLHRVLSGGGGWGKKAGLLSLDPLAADDDSHQASSAEPSSFGGDVQELNKALQQVVHDGDSIQFFISPSTSEANNELEAIQKLAKNAGDVWGWELGTIPSTADAIPGGSWQHSPTSANEIFVFRNTFGALAEGGMIVRRDFKLEARDSFSRIGGSKVDVPFSRFSARGLREEDADSMNHSLDPASFTHSASLVENLYGEAAPPLLGLPRQISLTSFTAEDVEVTKQKSNAGEDAEVSKQNSNAVGDALPRPFCLTGFTAEDVEAPKQKSDAAEDTLPRPFYLTSFTVEDVKGVPTNLPRQQQNSDAPEDPSPHQIRFVQSSIKGIPIRKFCSESKKVVAAEDGRTKEPEVRIRRYDTSFVFNAAYAASKLNQTQKKIENMKEQVHKILERANRRLELDISSLERERQQQRRSIWRAIQRANKDELSSLVDSLEAKAAASNDDALGTLTAEANSSTTIAELTSTLEELRTETARHRNEMTHLLHWTVSRARWIHKVNTSALHIYHHHITLRWHLSATILRLRKRWTRPLMAQRIIPLEKHLTRLRAFNRILLVNRPGLAPKDVIAYLDALELSHPTLASLKLSTAAQRVQRKLRLDPVAVRRARLFARRRWEAKRWRRRRSEGEGSGVRKLYVGRRWRRVRGLLRAEAIRKEEEMQYGEEPAWRRVRASLWVEEELEAERAARDEEQKAREYRRRLDMDRGLKRRDATEELYQLVNSWLGDGSGSGGGGGG